MQLTLIQRRLNPGIKKIHMIRDQVLQQFWDQGSKFKAQMWDQSAKNIPCYDPAATPPAAETQATHTVLHPV